MYGGFDVYKIYLGVKLHFTTKTYDYIRYGGKVNATLDSFTKRKDRYFFHKLSKQYGQDDILDFFVSNFLADSKRWVGNLLQNDGREVYLDYKKRKESFTYYFRNDCVLVHNDFILNNFNFDTGFRPIDQQHPRFLRLLLQKKISYQTAVVFEHFLSYMQNYNLEIKEKVVWPEIASKITRVKPFINFNITQCKLIMKEVFVNDGK